MNDHRGSYSGLVQYCISKLANVLTAVVSTVAEIHAFDSFDMQELANRLKEHNVLVYAVHPGTINTNVRT